MADIIRVFDFVVNFQEDKFERKDGSTDVITIVESDNKSTKFKFYFEEELQDGTNVLVKIKHNIGFAKDYVLCIKNKEAELVLTNSITIAGFLKMTISFVGNDNEILTPAQFQNKILVKEAITGETPIQEDDSKLLEGLISQVNLLNNDTKKAVEGIENTFDKINKKLDEKIETINEKDNEQDEDIKANKESIEELHAENLEIKAENERLRNDIKSIAVVNKVSGENIHIEDSSEARCEIEIGGNQKQETREGYNLLDLSNFSTQTKNGVTATKNEDGSIKLVGTNSGDTFNINLSTINGEIGDYIASGVTGGSRETYFLAIVQPGVKTFTEITSGSSNFSLTEETKIAANIYIIKGATINTTIYPMLLKGTENKSYEQYGTSPSIDYPSEVKAVGDNVNYFDINSVTNSLIILESGNLYLNDSWRTTDFIEVKANIYTLSWDSITDYFQCNIAFYDKDKKYLSYIQYANRTFSNTFEVKDNAKYMRISYAVMSGSTSVVKENIKLEIGNKRTLYSSYKCGSAKVNLQNKNYLSNIAQVSVIENGVTTTYDGEKFLCSGTTTAGFFGVIKRTNIYLPIGTYTFSQNATNYGRFVLRLYYEDGTFSTHYISSATWRVSFTTLKEAIGFGIFCDNLSSGLAIDYTVYVQLESGRTNTDWIKPKIQQIILPVQQPMLEGDYLDLENEKEHHEWAKVVFDGSEEWLKINYGFVVGVNTVDSNFKNKNKTKFDGYSNYLKVEKTSQAWTKINYCGWNTEGAFWIREDHTIAENIDDFKAYLKSKYDSGNPVVVYYRLETPVELDFTDRQKSVAKKIKAEAHTYKNITNISTESSEVNPIINVKYLKDTEAEHNKLQAQIDEIKQLLSPTETSAMLLNNMQTDLESEV